MNKFVKYSLWGVGGVVALTAAGAGYLIATFNPNDYKDKIIQAVKDNKQRNLRLDGDIKLTFFPSIGANLGKVSLSEFQSEQQFVSVENARVSLALMPLFSKQVVVEEVFVSGVTAALIKHKDGHLNIDDLLSKDESKKEQSQPVKFDISSVVIDKTNLSYVDESSGAQYSIKDLALKTGHVANGKATPIELSAKVSGNQPKLEIQTQLKTTLTFDLDKKQHLLQGLDLLVSGNALDINNLNLKLGGDINANLASSEFVLSKFKLNATGSKAKDNFDVALDVPNLNLTKQNFSGEKITANAKLNGAAGNLTAVLSLPDLTGNEELVASKGMVLNVDLQQPEQTIKAKISSPLEAKPKAKQISLNQLAIAMNATGEKLPGKSISSEMKGSFQADANKQNVHVNLAGGLLQSQVKAKVAVQGFDQPAVQFDIDVDQFDADLYMPKKTEAAGQPAAKSPEEPIDLSALRKLNLNGSVRIGALKAANVKVKDLRIDVKANNGVLNVSPLSANLYEGRTTGNITVNANSTPVISVNQNLTGVSVAPLTKDAANFDTLEGKGNIAINVTTQGNTVSAFKKALNGSMSLNLADGAIKGINVAKKIRDAGSLIGKGSQTQDANSAEKTDFSELKASFKINNGVAHNEDLSLKSPLLRMGGNGDIDIGHDSMNYLAKATLASTLEGQGGKDQVGGLTVPVRVSGPFTGLKYTLDFNAMMTDAAKQKLETKKQELKQSLGDKLKSGLQGLFK